MEHRFSKTRLSLTVSALLLGSQALAQSSSPLVLEEITVTAQKTTELLQDVPVSVNAVTGKVFEQNVAFEMKELNKFIPGMYANGNKNNPNIALRGVSTIAGGPTTPRANIFVDGSYQSQQQLSFYSQFDIARFEVLRGPQGTLYGKASPTGTISIHTRNPDLTEVEGFIKHSAGQHSLSNTQFGVSVPLIENELGVRFAGVYDENQSSDYEYANMNVDQLSRTKSGRVTFLWEPGDMFSGRLSHLYSEYDSNESRFIAGVEPGSPIPGLPSEGISPFERQDFSNFPRDANVRINQTIAELNFDFDWAVLTSQTYHATSTNDEFYDADSTPIDDAYRNTQINLSKLFNTELRLASSDNDFWNWMVGVYYANNDSRTTVDTKGTAVNGLPGNFVGPFPPFPVNISFVSATTLDAISEDWGAFTHNTFYLNDDWTLTLGARWNNERRSNVNAIATDIDIALDTGNGYETITSVPGALNARPAETTWIAWTGTAKLAYNLSADEMVYVTIDRGGRAGGQTLDLAGTTPPSISEYDPESSNSIEIGYKGELLDRRLRLNLSAYYQMYNDFQFYTQDQPLDTNLDGNYDEMFRITQNAKEVLAQGAEAEVTYLFNENLSGMLSVSYNDTKFEDFDDAACGDGIRTVIPADGQAYLACDLGGDRLGSDTGNWSVISRASYSLPLGRWGAEWYADALYNFYSTRVSPITRIDSPSYATADFFTGLRSTDGVWDLKLWVKNAFDKEAIQNINSYETTVAFPLRGTPTGLLEYDLLANPRQVGLTGTYNF
ncbi:TonB-dependent receptor [Parahaliea maris]|nr:TonB-dependent receptor [Parahaliea maris]